MDNATQQTPNVQARILIATKTMWDTSAATTNDGRHAARDHITVALVVAFPAARQSLLLFQRKATRLRGSVAGSTGATAKHCIAKPKLLASCT